MTVFLSFFLLLMALLVCHFYTYLLSLAVLLCKYRSEYLAPSSLLYRALQGKEEIRLPQLRSWSEFRDTVQVMGFASYNPPNTSGTAGVDVGIRGKWLKFSWASPVNARWGIPFGNHTWAVLCLLLRHSQILAWKLLLESKSCCVANSFLQFSSGEPSVFLQWLGDRNLAKH